MATWRILNQGDSLKSFPNPEQPEAAAIICDDTHPGAFEQWEINTSGNTSTIRNHVTWLYAHSYDHIVMTVSEEVVTPGTWEIIELVTGVSAIRVPGQNLYWTVDGKDVGTSHSLTELKADYHQFVVSQQIKLAEWTNDVTQLFTIVRP